MITKELINKTKVILMGDFNAVSNPSTDRSNHSPNNKSWKPEAEIFNFLEDWAFTDVQLLWEESSPSPTWSNKSSYSRIDYI
jgi:exonuclease III